jgi:Xaa-Pro aminopeptidase
MSGDKLAPIQPISKDERRQRLDRLRSAMAERGVGAVLLGATRSLFYFTGLDWRPSERLLGALITSAGITYVAPGFERSRVEAMAAMPGEVAVWEEEENPYRLVASLLAPHAKLALDEQLPLFAFHGLAAAVGVERLSDAASLTLPMRARKSPAEIALLQRAKRLTLEVHRRVHERLEPGIRASEVVAFIDAQHRALAGSPSTFCSVSFGVATSFPHGGSGNAKLERGDLILIDTGTRVDGYQSDITRTYALDEPSAEIARVWRVEKEAQAAVFAAAKLGATCESLDEAARKVVVAHGFGPDYRLPGIPHRTGHGIGLETHESPNLVRGDHTLLAPGMCFSNEPMIVVPGRFGVRLEDHFHMTEAGPRWFTEPQPSVTDPFAGIAPLAVS